MQYLLTVFLIFLIIFLVSFVCNIFQMDKKLDEKVKSKYEEYINEITLVDKAINDNREEKQEDEDNSNMNEELVIQLDTNEEEEEEEEEENDNELIIPELIDENSIVIKKDKGNVKTEKELVLFSVNRAFDDLAHNSVILLISMGVMSLVLQGVSILLNNFDYTVEKGYIILLTTFFLLVFGGIAIKAIVIWFGSDILAHFYIKKGIKEDENKTINEFENDKIKIDIIIYIFMFILSFLVYFLIATKIGLGNNLLCTIVLAVINTISYRLMLNAQCN